MQIKPSINIELDAKYKRLINVTIDGKRLSFEVSDDGPNPELISCSQNQFETIHRHFALGYWFGCFDESGAVES
jgi:hypothetical protein